MEPLKDGVIATYEEHEDSVYASCWSTADPWVFASLSYDGRLVINKVPRAEKYKILLWMDLLIFWFVRHSYILSNILKECLKSKNVQFIVIYYWINVIYKVCPWFLFNGTEYLFQIAVYVTLRKIICISMKSPCCRFEWNKSI